MSIFSPFVLETFKSNSFELRNNKYFVSDAFFLARPWLLKSKFFYDGSCDTYLAYVVGERRELTGAYYQGMFFGVNEVIMDLEELYGEGTIIELLTKLLDPMGGQQKNFLVALATVVQTPVSAPDFVTESKLQIPIKHEMWRNYDELDNGKVKIKKDYNEVQVFLDGELYTKFRPLAFDRNMVLQTIALRENGVFSDSLTVGKEKIIVAGSRMNINSGIWHKQFAQILSDYGFSGSIDFIDYNEEPDSEKIGKFDCRWSLPMSKYPKHTVFIDDIQSSNLISDLIPNCRKYSLKKKKRGFFNFENRHFNLVQDILPFNVFSECQCERCAAVAFCSYRLGGYSAFQRIQLELSKMGPVCVRERLEERYSVVYERGKYNAEKIDRYLKELKMCETKPKSFIERKLRGRKVYIASYYSEFQSSHDIRCYKDFDVAVISNVNSLVDIGFLPLIVSQESLILCGYDKILDEGWFFYSRKKVDTGDDDLKRSKFKMKIKL